MDVIKKLIDLGYAKQAQLIKDMALASILLKTQSAEESEFDIGEIKIGGMPDLPAGFIWPRFNDKPLAFIAQINLADIAAYDRENQLPDNGLLSFFYEGGKEVWGYDPNDKDGFKAIHFTNTGNLKETPLPSDLEDYLKISPCKVVFEYTTTYPSDTCELEKELFGETGSKDHEDFFNVLYEAQEDTINKIFGHPDLIQGDIFLETQLVTNGLYCGDSTGYQDPLAKELKKSVSDWMLLFQIDSDSNANIMWG